MVVPLIIYAFTNYIFYEVSLLTDLTYTEEITKLPDR